MTRTRVGVLRGGTSSEYDLSLKTGSAILNALPEDAYDVRDIFIDKRGYWHLRGMPVDAARALAQLDVAVNALHGGVGEDGTVQRLLERAGVPYTGVRASAAIDSLNKARARELLLAAGVRVPPGDVFSHRDGLTTGEMAQLIFARFGPPFIIKPATEGASRGIRIVATIHDLPDAIGDVIDAFGAAIVEQLLRGHDVSVGVIEDFRDQELYVLPPAHVIAPEGSRFIESDHHLDGSLRVVVPSAFELSDKVAMADMARRAHKALGLRHFSRADIMMTNHGPYLLEVNAIPGLYPGASFPHMLESVGSSVGEFAQHAINLARNG